MRLTSLCSCQTGWSRPRTCFNGSQTLRRPRLFGLFERPGPTGTLRLARRAERKRRLRRSEPGDPSASEITFVEYQGDRRSVAGEVAQLEEREGGDLYLEGIREQLLESGSWEALLRKGERHLPYQQRVLTTALASSLRQSLALSGQAGLPPGVPALGSALAPPGAPS